jgi:hypothetical protein
MPVDEQQTVSPRGTRVPPSAKGYVHNLALDAGSAHATAQTHPFTFWYRPGPIKERLAAEYQTVRPLGHPAGYHVYEGGENTSLSLDLYVHRLLLARDLPATADAPPVAEGQALRGRVVTASQLQALSARMLRGVRYLQALLVPPTLAAGLMGGAPPPCLLVLPGLLALRCRLISLEIAYTQQDLEGLPIELTATCAFEEAPLARYTMQDVLLRGSQRTWGLP